MMAMRYKLKPSTVTLEKVQNFILANQESDAQATEVRSLPYMLNLDTINVCNLECPFCVTGTKQLGRKQIRIPIDSAKAVIDKVKSHILIARFHNWGEPFLNKEIFELIRYAKDAGIYTTASSNLSVPTKNLAEKILDSGLDQIHVSIDGLEQDTLQKYRRNAKLDLVLKNIREIVALKKERGCDHPRLELAFLVFKHNEHEIDRLEDMRKELGVETFEACRAFVFHESFVPANPEFQPALSIWQDNCHYLYSELMIEADGHISPCCTNTSDRYDVGTIDELNDLHKVWNKPVFQAMRAKGSGRNWVDKDGNALETLCDTCSYIGKKDDNPEGRLSPLPPALKAEGEEFHHGLDDLTGRV
jgi:radical SAM protein with 4Fe4S-binding SPASM domain